MLFCDTDWSVKVYTMSFLTDLSSLTLIEITGTMCYFLHPFTACTCQIGHPSTSVILKILNTAASHLCLETCSVLYWWLYFMSPNISTYPQQIASVGTVWNNGHWKSITEFINAFQAHFKSSSVVGFIMLLQSNEISCIWDQYPTVKQNFLPIGQLMPFNYFN